MTTNSHGKSYNGRHWCYYCGDRPTVQVIIKHNAPRLQVFCSKTCALLWAAAEQKRQGIRPCAECDLCHGTQDVLAVTGISADGLMWHVYNAGGKPRIVHADAPGIGVAGQVDLISTWLGGLMASLLEDLPPQYREPLLKLYTRRLNDCRSLTSADMADGENMKRIFDL